MKNENLNKVIHHEIDALNKVLNDYKNKCKNPDFPTEAVKRAIETYTVRKHVLEWVIAHNV